MTWRAIDSAPKIEGTKIFAWCVHANAKFCDDPIKDGYEGAVVAEWTDFNHGGWVWHGMCGQFTHWMPYDERVDRRTLCRPKGTEP